MNTQNMPQTKSQFINNLQDFLIEYLRAEIQGEKRSPITGIICEHDIHEGYTECYVIVAAQYDDKEVYWTTDYVDASDGYDIPEGLRVPVHLEWRLNKKEGTVTITAKVYHKEVEVEGD